MEPNTVFGSTLGAGVGAFLVWNAVKPIPYSKVVRSKASRQKHGDNSAATKQLIPDGQMLPAGSLDLRRKMQIVRGGPSDHAGEVTIMSNGDFNIDKTIFGSLDTGLAKTVIASRIGIKIFWSDESAERITYAFQKVPRAPRHDKGLCDFLLRDCDFAVEHADGSFMDHLKFCHEYSVAHYKDRSPRVLLLHSIMGVGTNFFPMPASKIPKLQSLLTEFEFEQIAMFPTVLRLLYHGPLLDELVACSREKLDRLTSATCYRVIDNKKIVMDADCFWAQLNYQVIHLLDFLPCASWKLSADDAFLANFTTLHGLLTRAGKLQCNIDFDIAEGQSIAVGPPLTLGGFIRGIVPSSILLSMSKNAIAKFSAQINHSLDYELCFKPVGRL